MGGLAKLDAREHEADNRGGKASRESAGSEIEQTKTDNTAKTDVDHAGLSVDQQVRPTHKTERDKEAMMRALSRGDAPLWDNPIGWDVMVLCGPFSWRLHRHIIDHCAYFAARTEPWPSEGGRQGAYDSHSQARPSRRLHMLVLNKHDPGQLANVLRFLYVRDYPGALCCRTEPLYADCLLTNAAMFIAAASVACRPMMAFAGASISRYASILQTHLTRAVVCDTPSIDYAVLRLAIPLRQALMILHEQPATVRSRDGDHDGVLWPLRRMLTRFAAAVLPQLAANPAFHAQFSSEWDGQVFMQQLEADVTTLMREESVEGKEARAETDLSRTCTTLSLLRRLAKAEREWIAEVLKRQDENIYDSDNDNHGEDSDCGKKRKGSNPETEVAQLVRQLQQMGTE